VSNWYKVHFRKKFVVVEGEAELARIKARKVPKVILVEPAKTYTCEECGKISAWTDSWRWYGSYQDLDEGKPVIHLCSPECQEHYAMQTPRKRRRQPKDFSRGTKVGKWEPLVNGESNWKELHDARLAANHRRFPFPVHPHVEGVSCRWCGDPIEDRGERGHKQRTWHRTSHGDDRDCWREYCLHTDSGAQYWHLMKRDGPGCALCPPGSGRYVAGGTPYHSPARQEGWSRIRWSVTLQVDHVVPLWKVAGLPDDERRGYFGPDNLWLLCERHHSRKSALEATERATNA
jgi:hypothetical protein